MMQIGEQGIRLNLMQKWDMNELDGDGRLHKVKPNAGRSRHS